MAQNNNKSVRLDVTIGCYTKRRDNRLLYQNNLILTDIGLNALIYPGWYRGVHVRAFQLLFLYNRT